MTDGPTAAPGALDVRRAVVDKYAALARGALTEQGVEVAGAACCTPASAPAPLELVDLRDGAAARPTAEFGSTLYSTEQLGALPEGAQQASAGCGNPVAIAELRPGEAVLDLGSGGGIDCFLAAQQVGPEGAVWGLDMTPEMVQLARRNAEQVGATNVRFRLGEIEDLPFPDASFDAVISNCVINLSTDKPRVFAEAARVLRPGGRLRVSDMVLTRALPPEQAGSLAEWAGCVAGALPLEEYTRLIEAAGFVDVRADYTDDESGIVSAYVSAVRPA